MDVNKQSNSIFRELIPAGKKVEITILSFDYEGQYTKANGTEMMPMNAVDNNGKKYRFDFWMATPEKPSGGADMMIRNLAKQCNIQITKDWLNRTYFDMFESFVGKKIFVGGQEKIDELTGNVISVNTTFDKDVIDAYEEVE